MGNTTMGSNPIPSSMSGHKKWSEIKHKRDAMKPSIMWTGNNEKAVEEFALDNSPSFGFTRGSTHGRLRWYHKLFEKLSVPRSDSTVLEIFPDRPKEGFELYLENNSDEDLNKLREWVIYALDQHYTNEDNVDKIHELFEVLSTERNREYSEWHWTTARPGDTIFADGTVQRADD